MAAKPSTDQKGKRPHGKNQKFDHKRKFQEKEQTPSNKKRALKAERQSHRRHANTVRPAKEVWANLRIKSNDAETNAKLCGELYDMLKGKMMEVAMQHDASRMVQAVLQFGSKEERLETVRELCATEKESAVNLAELCKIQYAHFVVLKMIKYCSRDEECVRLIVKNLKKQMTKLAVHSVGSRVVELLFATFSSKSVAPLKLELYGPQYALFASANPSEAKDAKSNAPSLPTLATFVANNPDKREPTVTHLQSIIQKGLDKSLTGFSYFHSLLSDYVSIASPNDIRDFLTPAIAEHSLHLISTRAGTKVVCECTAYGTVKERKKILKCFKGYARSSLLHRDAYMAILRLVDVMDDTVLINKMLLAELHQNPDAKKEDEDNDEEGDDPSPILDLVLSDTGSKLFLLLLISKDEMVSSDDGKSSNRWLKNFDPYEIEVLHRNPCVIENEESVPTSKKEEETRRSELLVYLRELLMDACTKHTEELMRSKTGSKVLIEVCEQFPSEMLFQAVVEACADSLELKDSDDTGAKYLTILEDPIGHLTLKHLFLAESKKDADDDDDGTSLAKAFLSKFESKFGAIASTNRGAFVLSALIQVSSVKKDVKAALKGNKKEITKLAKNAAGAKVLLDAINAKK